MEGSSKLPFLSSFSGPYESSSQQSSLGRPSSTVISSNLWWTYRQRFWSGLECFCSLLPMSRHVVTQCSLLPVCGALCDYDHIQRQQKRLRISEPKRICFLSAPVDFLRESPVHCQQFWVGLPVGSWCGWRKRQEDRYARGNQVKKNNLNYFRSCLLHESQHLYAYKRIALVWPSIYLSQFRGMIGLLLLCVFKPSHYSFFFL